MSKIYNPYISLLHDLNTGTQTIQKTGLYHNVVQKGNVGSGFVYALQHHKSDNYVFRARPQTNITFGSPIVKFVGNSAGGHSQTWEYANKPGCWFVGTKGKLTGKYYWDTQIARVKIPGIASYTSNTQMPRLSYLNRAGGFGLAGTDLLRSEAAVSPNYRYFLLAVIDKLGNGYFTLYYLDDVNSALDAAGTSDFNIEGLVPVQAYPPFMIPHLTDDKVIGSIQGYDIDNDLNIYISSEHAPAKYSISSEPRHIYKIPWGASRSEEWDDVDLDGNRNIDNSNDPTELESVQVIGTNHLYLTVSYHGYINYSDWGTVANRIFEVSW